MTPEKLEEILDRLSTATAGLAEGIPQIPMPTAWCHHGLTTPDRCVHCSRIIRAQNSLHALRELYDVIARERS